MPTPDRTSLGEIVEAGRELLERDGLDGLTMQAVATRVGVRAPSLYKRVSNRDALVALVADATLREGVGLLAIYSLGLAAPFLLATVLVDRFMTESSRFRMWLPRVQKASGALVLLIATLLLTDSLSRLNEYAAWSPF